MQQLSREGDQHSRASKPHPFSVQNALTTTSIGSLASDCSDGAANMPAHGCSCSCANCCTLQGCSSLQLQEQHLLSNNANCSNSNCSSSCTDDKSACPATQDMVVMVISNTDRKPSENSVHGAGDAKARMSHASSAAGRSMSVTSAVSAFCNQNPRQVTQEFCLRFVALLLVVLATVGLAYRLAKRDS